MDNDEIRRDGGAAFPQSTTSREGRGGMTLRDYFAGQAIGGLLAGRDNHPKSAEHVQNAASWAYGIADAMLEARKQ